jgi:threonine dehydratase
VSVTLDSIRAAAGVLRGAVVETPCLESKTLSEITGASVWLKFECLQFTGSFKDRGALIKLTSLSAEQRRAGVVAMSAGNHAQGVAYHAKRLGIPAVIVMPRFTPNVKVEHTRGFGAEVVLFGDDLEQAAGHAHELERSRGLAFVHPYDDPEIIRGQGTVALEMLAQAPGLDALVIPVGGGGLISGCAIAAKSLVPGIEVLGVQTARFPSMRQALHGDPIVCGSSTIAEGIAVKQPGRLTLGIVRERVSEILLVEESAIEDAVLLLLEVEKTMVEGAGAAPLAAVLSQRDRFAGRRVGLVLTGGNIDLLDLSSIIQRGLVHSARLTRVTIELRDVPGALAEIARRIGDAGANIVEVHHQRAFTHAPLTSAEVEFVLETRGRAHLAELVGALVEAGYRVRVTQDFGRGTVGN